MRLKQQLRDTLSLNGMSAAELARKSGVSKQTICDWMSGSGTRSLVLLKKVANTLNLSLDELCFGTARNPSKADHRNSHVGIELHATVDFSGRIRNVNSGLKEALAWELSSLISRPLIELSHFSDWHRTTARFQQLSRTGDLFSFDSHILTKDGKLIWLDWNAVVSHAHGLVHCYGHDVTDILPQSFNLRPTVKLRRALDLALSVSRLISTPHHAQIKLDIPEEITVPCCFEIAAAGILGLLNCHDRWTSISAEERDEKIYLQLYSSGNSKPVIPAVAESLIESHLGELQVRASRGEAVLEVCFPLYCEKWKRYPRDSRGSTK